MKVSKLIIITNKTFGRLLIQEEEQQQQQVGENF